MTLKSQTRAAEYHAKASDAAALAASSALLRVRELHELAATRWTHLAELEDRRSVSLASRYGRAALPGAVMTDEQRIEIAAPDVDCGLEADAS
jgi:hypothetical protein